MIKRVLLVLTHDPSTACAQLVDLQSPLSPVTPHTRLIPPKPLLVDKPINALTFTDICPPGLVILVLLLLLNRNFTALLLANVLPIAQCVLRRRTVVVLVVCAS